MTDPERTPTRPSFLRLLSLVLWGFFGVRKRRESLADAQIRPVHIIVAGVLGALTFVLTLVLVVRFITR